MKKIVTILGARPQFIKASVVSAAIAADGDFKEVVVHTGQHFDTNMSDVFFTELGIKKPVYSLNINGGGHGEMTGRMLIEIEKVLLKEKPDMVMVYGDTNSTLAGALAASKLHIPVAHVEAGLRSFNMEMPEEINRILTDRISDLLLCPTEAAIRNLHVEGYKNFDNIKIVKTGDVMQDAAIYYSSLAHPPVSANVDFSLDTPFALATIHRAENTDDPVRLQDIFKALIEIASDLPVLFPMHPRTKQKLAAINLDHDILLAASQGRLACIEPVGYLEMVYLLQRAQVILTDSGGLQKEAYFFGKPCITLRDQTEWVELVEQGVNMLAGADKFLIIQSFGKMKDMIVSDANKLYGDGTAAANVVDALINYFVEAG